MLNRFQSDDLEARFGQYRQMSGANYHISVTQVLESERKLKMISLLNLKSAKNGVFHLKEFLDTCGEDVDYNHSDNIELFEDALILTEDEWISHEEVHILIYIAGYIVHTINRHLQCKSCKSLTCLDKNLETDNNFTNQEVYQYLQHLDRDGLKFPKDYFVNIISQMLLLFKVLISNRFENLFLSCKCQRSVLKNLSVEMPHYKDITIYETCEECGGSISVLVEKCISKFCNILLNNYSKTNQNKIASKEVKHRKVKKLSSK